MIKSLPTFRRGAEYVELRGGRWRFRVKHAVVVPLDRDVGMKVEFYDKWGRCWAVLDGDALLIAGGYAWDGATPKRFFFGRWWGTPDPESTRLASLVHDVLYQFLHTSHMPFNREDADEAFHDVMRLAGAKVRLVYWGAVRLFGGLFAGNAPADGEVSLRRI